MPQGIYKQIRILPAIETGNTFHQGRPLDVSR